jgi:hypothetical protein
MTTDQDGGTLHSTPLRDDFLAPLELADRA